MKYAVKEWNMERAMGIEPTSPAWEAGVLPLDYARNFYILCFFPISVNFDLASFIASFFVLIFPS